MLSTFDMKNMNTVLFELLNQNGRLTLQSQDIKRRRRAGSTSTTTSSGEVANLSTSLPFREIVQSTEGLAMGKATLSKRQLSELKKVFMQFDKDNDGSIAEVELGALLRSFGLKPDQQQLTTLIHKADKNNNGLVEFSEFISLIRPNIEFEEVYNQEQLHALFHKFDRDGNGYITAVELAHSMARLGYMLSVRELTEMMREADIDGDGRISFDEFVLAMTNASSIW